MNKNVSLSTSLKNVHTGVIIYAAIALFGGIITTSGSTARATSSTISTIMSGDIDKVLSLLGGFNFTTLLVNAALIAGIFFYIVGLRGFRPHLDQVGQKAIGKVLTGLYTMIAASVLGIIPFIGFFSGLISLIGFIIMMVGYSDFRKSPLLNKEGIAGAKKIYNGLIMALIAVVVVVLPLIGGFAALVLYIVYYFFLVTGWGDVRKSFGA